MKIEIIVTILIAIFANFVFFTLISDGFPVPLYFWGIIIPIFNLGVGMIISGMTIFANLDEEDEEDED